MKIFSSTFKHLCFLCYFALFLNVQLAHAQDPSTYQSKSASFTLASHAQIDKVNDFDEAIDNIYAFHQSESLIYTTDMQYDDVIDSQDASLSSTQSLNLGHLVNSQVINTQKVNKDSPQFVNVFTYMMLAFLLALIFVRPSTEEDFVKMRKQK